MNNYLRVPTAVAAVLCISGCATPRPIGNWYTDISLPGKVTSASGKTKTGTAVCTSFFSLYAAGDCSISKAMEEGGITTVTSTDWKVKNVLGIYGTYTLIVTGE